MASNMVAKVVCLLSVAALANALAYGWGRNDYAQLGLGHSNPVYLPTSIPYYASIPIFDILTATNYHIALGTNGSAYGSGLQYFGQFANGYSSNTAITRPIPCPNLNTSLDISLPGTSCNAHMNTNLLGWGNVAGYVQAKTTGSFPRIQTALPSLRFDGKVLAVNSVMEGVIVRLANNTVWAAGTNGNGRLGIGNTATTYNFVEVPFWRSVPLRQIFSSQSQHVCAVAVNGSLYCWGQNTFGQLGVGDTLARSSPTRVAFFEDGGYEIYKVVYGDIFTVVLTCSGRIFAFGANTFGQLGTGVPDANSHSRPEEVKINNGNIGNETVVEVVSGASQTMVRTNANNWFVWGGGATGSLGLGAGRDQYTPVQNPIFKNFSINRIKSSSQSFNFFGWQDPSVTDQRIGCPIPVNECLTGAADCATNAYCTDMERGYSCTCAGGWIGDGYASGSGCVNEFSCEIIGNLCVENTTCDDSSGIAVCTCPLGFTGDGRRDGVGCVDIDECLGNACAVNAYCTNTAPGYHCTCNPGYIGDPDISGCTILCQPGQYATNLTNCDFCPPGTYTDITDAKNCFPCPSGTYNTQWGSDAVEDCVKCPVGGYSSPKSTYCSLCIHGYTNDPALIHVDDTTCTECPLGTYGYYGQCYPCNQGKYSNDAVAKRCRNCPPGFANNITAGSTTLCSPCPGGTHTRGGMSGCTICPAGYYSPPGSKDCLKCKPGTSTNGLSGQSSCTGCLAGYFNSKFASPTCSACPAGTYSYGTGSTQCKRCSPGTYSSSSASTACTSCGAGTYASGSGSSRCINCDSGSATIDGVTCAPCKAGNFFDSDTRTCKPCAPGSFVAVSGVTSCFACSPGTFASESGSTYCKRCGVNTYSSASTGFINCTSCPLGSSSPGGAYTCS